jgi:hypothetical protein
MNGKDTWAFSREDAPAYMEAEMQIFEAVKTPAPSGTEHVALLDGDGTVIYHEELPAGDPVSLRHLMFLLQAELDICGQGVSRQVYRGKVWPPEGYREDESAKIIIGMI